MVNIMRDITYNVEMDRFFERIDNALVGRKPGEGMKPSEVMKDLNDMYIGLGDAYEDWWNESGEDWY